jgi:hypothetical protein
MNTMNKAKFTVDVSIEEYDTLLELVGRHNSAAIKTFKNSLKIGYDEVLRKCVDPNYFQCPICNHLFSRRSGKSVQYFNKEFNQPVSILICRNEECSHAFSLIPVVSKKEVS